MLDRRCPRCLDTPPPRMKDTCRRVYLYYRRYVLDAPDPAADAEFLATCPRDDPRTKKPCVVSCVLSLRGVAREAPSCLSEVCTAGYARHITRTAGLRAATPRRVAGTSSRAAGGGRAAPRRSPTSVETCSCQTSAPTTCTPAPARARPSATRSMSPAARRSAAPTGGGTLTRRATGRRPWLKPARGPRCHSKHLHCPPDDDELNTNPPTPCQ